jgi:hypothetical protein
MNTTWKKQHHLLTLLFSQNATTFFYAIIAKYINSTGICRIYYCYLLSRKILQPFSCIFGKKIQKKQHHLLTLLFSQNTTTFPEILTERTTCPNELPEKTTYEKNCQKGPPLYGGRTCQATRGTCRRWLWRQLLPQLSMAAR